MKKIVKVFASIVLTLVLAGGIAAGQGTKKCDKRLGIDPPIGKNCIPTVTALVVKNICIS